MREIFSCANASQTGSQKARKTHWLLPHYDGKSGSSIDTRGKKWAAQFGWPAAQSVVFRSLGTLDSARAVRCRLQAASFAATARLRANTRGYHTTTEYPKAPQHGNTRYLTANIHSGPEAHGNVTRRLLSTAKIVAADKAVTSGQ
ncbi:hypothetical protein F503_08123 [Ophiostoma piceae UAMH 11346]|uniref:Uncharacterized protein n=1 Tax=Ophiostoma piceae (strain UAMH 11346) TaxID=1262450 RepID=S3C3V4_OPHP1|nr:hypothetical protein F503_08123 [Ophiostoma piceae UAMH 11346]